MKALTPLYFGAALALSLLTACTESFEDRCRREAREYTEKQCPRAIDPCTTLDSMTFSEQPVGFNYYYSVHGALDSDERMDSASIQDYHDMLRSNVRKDIGLKTYKDKGFTFSYHYVSASTRKLYFVASFGPDDYKR